MKKIIISTAVLLCILGSCKKEQKLTTMEKFRESPNYRFGSVSKGKDTLIKMIYGVDDVSTKSIFSYCMTLYPTWTPHYDGSKISKLGYHKSDYLEYKIIDSYELNVSNKIRLTFDTIALPYLKYQENDTFKFNNFILKKYIIPAPNIGVSMYRFNIAVLNGDYTITETPSGFKLETESGIVIDLFNLP